MSHAPQTPLVSSVQTTSTQGVALASFTGTTLYEMCVVHSGNAARDLGTRLVCNPKIFNMKILLLLDIRNGSLHVHSLFCQQVVYQVKPAH